MGKGPKRTLELVKYRLESRPLTDPRPRSLGEVFGKRIDLTIALKKIFGRQIELTIALTTFLEK